eukprot:1158773-Pelagomonas_calceolata.AAC.29
MSSIDHTSHHHAPSYSLNFGCHLSLINSCIFLITTLHTPALSGAMRPLAPQMHQWARLGSLAPKLSSTSSAF